jgi:hypothetical protein
LLALAAAGGLSGTVLRSPLAEFHQRYSLRPNGSIVIQNLYGDVRIVAWDRDEVLVEAFKKSNDPRQLEDARIVVDSSSAQLSIRTQYAGIDAEHPASVDYRITVPRGANLDNVHLVNGGLSITGIAGNIKASSVNGSIHADRLEGEADLSTVNGRLEAGFNRIERSNTISLSSVNGPIRLSLPWGAAAELSALNLSGGIESEFGHVSRATDGHRLRTVINHGGAQIRVKNVNGGISIHGSWGRRTDRPWT